MCRAELFRHVKAEVQKTEVSEELQGMQKAGGACSLESNDR